jgi:hypothetical protein
VPDNRMFSFSWDMPVRPEIHVWSPRPWAMSQIDHGWMSLARPISPPYSKAYCALLSPKSSAQEAPINGCQMGHHVDLYCTRKRTALFEDLVASRAWNTQCDGLGSGSIHISGDVVRLLMCGRSSLSVALRNN